MEHPAHPAHPIHELIRQRFSPRAFGDQPVPEEHLLSLLEAARWAPSCFNEQPWHFIVAPRSEAAAFSAIVDCLMPANQLWAARAPVLMLSVARTVFTQNGQPNPHAWFDVGQATATLALEATARGLRVHQMAGFDREKARHVLNLPAHHEPVTAIALGYPGHPDTLPEKLRARELAPRQRKPLTGFAFKGAWGTPYPDPRSPSDAKDS